MLLLTLLPLLCASSQEEGGEDGGEARSQQTWRALRINRQKLRELGWDQFQEKQQQVQKVKNMQVSTWQKCTFI